MIRILFTRKWLMLTLFVVLAIGVLIRLGSWQLDRLEGRKVFNARVIDQQSAPEMLINSSSLEQDLYDFEYRKVRIQGTFLPEHEILLRNQAWHGQIGYLLYTPMLIEGSQRVIFIERGWIPEEKASPSERIEYYEPGNVELRGILRRAETDFNVRLNPDPTLAVGASRLELWNYLDLERVADQMDIPISNMYIQILSENNEEEFPVPLVFQLDLSEGSHLGYAGQFFIFALILVIGYPFYVQKQANEPEIQ